MKKVVTSLLITLIMAGCLVIGLAVSAADTPALTIRSASLSLESNVYIWFDMSLQNVDKDADDYGMIFWKTTQKAGSYTYENAQGNDAAVVRGKAAGQWAHDDTLNCNVVTYKYGIAAKEMADIVYAQGYAKVGESYYYSSIVPYSAVRYASNKLGLTPGVTGTDDENLKSLLRSMLEYGAAAQKYFNYNTDNLATDILNVKYSEGLEFTSNGDGTCYVSGIGTCTDTDVVIPKVSPSGDKVTGIGKQAFYGCKSLTSVTIPDSVTSIGDRAFYSCEGLASLIIPNGVVSIGKFAFSFCDGLTKVTLPESLTYIGTYAFSSANSLYLVTNNSDLNLNVGGIDYGGVARYAKILIDKSGIKTYRTDGSVEYVDTSDGFLFEKKEDVYTLIAYIGNENEITLPLDVNGNEYKISNMRGVLKVIIPDGMLSIDNSAFSSCTTLRSISIPNSLTSIGRGVLYGCTNLENIKVAKENTIYHSAGDCLIETEAKVLIAGCKNSIIPTDGSVTNIGDSAFAYCENMTSIVIPDGVTSIDRYAFMGCSGLQSIVIPASVANIEESAFSNCTNLMSVVLTEGLVKIGRDAFAYCGCLAQIYIPASVTSIGNGNNSYDANFSYGAFVGCSNLKSIEVNAENHVYHSAGNCLINTDKKELVAGCINSVIPTDYSVTRIGHRAFYGMYLTDITIPAGVTSIGDYAFASCNKLTNVIIQDGVTTIGMNAFSQCNSLTSITIPCDLTDIRMHAFYNCRSLTTIVFKGTEALWNSVNKQQGWDMSSGNYSIVFEPETGYSEGLEFTYANRVFENGAWYVSGVGTCTDTDIIIPKWTPDGARVTGIGELAFNGCANITSITVPFGITDIRGAFQNCSGLTSINLPGSLGSIGASAFQKCTSLTSVNIPNSVTSIGNSAFSYCTSLTDIKLPASVSSIDNYAFSNCTSLKSITIPDGVSSIGNYVFSGCTNLTGIIIPDGVTSIGNFAFSDCTSLTSIIIPDGVTSIGDSVLSNCTSLANITIPSSVTSIGREVFCRCTSLETITFQGTEEQWNAISKGYHWDYSTGSYTLIFEN